MSLDMLGLLVLDLAVIVVLARLLGALARRLGQPAVIGEILGGILLGPTLLGATPARRSASKARSRISAQACAKCKRQSESNSGSSPS